MSRHRAIQQCIDKLLEDYPSNFKDWSPDQQVDYVFERYFFVINKIRENTTFISQGPIAPPCSHAEFQQPVMLNLLNKVYVLPNTNAFKTNLLKTEFKTAQPPSNKAQGIANMYKLFMSIFYDALCVATMTATFLSGASELALPLPTPLPPYVHPVPMISSVFAQFPDYIGSSIGNAIKDVIVCNCPNPADLDSCEVVIKNISPSGTPTGEEIRIEEVATDLDKRQKMYEYIFDSMYNILFLSSRKLRTTNTYTPSPAAANAGCVPIPMLPSYLYLMQPTS